MEYAYIVFKQIANMFIFMSIGFILYKTKLIKAEQTKAFGTLLVYVIAPANILRAFSVAYSQDLLKSFALSTILSILGLLLSGLVAKLIFKKDELATLAVTYSNTGYLGIPLIEAAFGFATTIYIVPLNILVPLTHWYYAKFLLDRENFKFDFKHIITNHIVIVSMIAFILFVFGLGDKLPTIISSPISSLTSLNGPIAMILIGTYLAQAKLSDMFKIKVLSKVAVRNFLIPFITVLLFKSLPFDETLILPIVIALSTSIGVNSPIYAQMYNKDYTYSCELVTMSTLFSIISLPLIMTIVA